MGLALVLFYKLEAMQIEKSLGISNFHVSNN